MKNLSIITALYKIIANVKEVIAWDFPPRQYKKATESLLSELEKNGIPGEQTVADWPHFTLAYVPPMNKEQQQKIKLLAPLYSTRVKTKGLTLLVGEKFPKVYIGWDLEFDDVKKVKALIEDINEITDTTQKFSFKPHVSLVMVDKKYHSDILEIWDKLEDSVKRHKTAYKPEQLQLWSNMSIYDIEDMELK